MTDYTPAQRACIEKHRDINVDHPAWAEYITDEFVEILAAFGIEVEVNHSTPRNGKSHSRPEINWDVSFCQGSGAQFACGINLGEFLRKGRAALTAPEVPDPDGNTDYSYLLGEDCTHKLGKMLVTQLQHWESQLLVYQLHPELQELIDNTRIRCTLSHSHYNHSGAMDVAIEIDEDIVEVPDEDEAPETYAAHKRLHDLIVDEEDWRDFLRGLADQLHSDLEDECMHQTSDEQVWEAIEANELFDPADEEDDESDEPAHTTAQAA